MATSNHLPHHLRAHRKRLALLQKDMAVLLGLAGTANVCRFESFTRIPDLRTAFAYELIFKKSMSELFAGLREDIRRQIASRARLMISHRPKIIDPKSQRKWNSLAEISLRLVQKTQ